MNWISTFVLCVVSFPLLNAILPPPGGLYNELAEILDEAAETMSYYQTRMLMRKLFQIVRKKKQAMRKLKEVNQEEKHKLLESPGEDDDCVEEDYNEPKLIDFGRDQAVFGSVTDFPSAARDQRNPYIYIGDSNSQRSGDINNPPIPKKKRCKKYTQNNGYRKIGGHGQDSGQNSNSYLLVKLQ